MLRILWAEDVEVANTYLSNLNPMNVKNAGIIIKLKKYIDRKSASITFYAMRRFLNLRISSNAVEKANNTMVAKRQKQNYTP